MSLFDVIFEELMIGMPGEDTVLGLPRCEPRLTDPSC